MAPFTRLLFSKHFNEVELKEGWKCKEKEQIK